MASELTVLAHMLDRIGESNRRSRDFTLNSLRDMLVEVVACFPIYRTYVNEQGWDARRSRRARARHRPRAPAQSGDGVDDLRLLPRGDAAARSRRRAGRRSGSPRRLSAGRRARKSAERLRFAMKFQQYTGPLQAKGLEDTAFYRHNVLLSLNEVGGDPSRFGVSAAEFHELNQLRRQDWPYEMIATVDARHQARRGRARAHRRALGDARRLGARGRRSGCASTRRRGRSSTASRRRIATTSTASTRCCSAPGRSTSRAVVRLQAYMTKAVKEGQAAFELDQPERGIRDARSRTFVERVLAGPEAAKFLPAFQPFQERVARAGLVNSLSQVVLKIASPGVPDFYQGTELWDLNLVDPDNRRPVDFAAARRQRSTASTRCWRSRRRSARAGDRARCCAHWQDGDVKLLRDRRRPAAARARRRRCSSTATTCRSRSRSPSTARVIAFARRRRPTAQRRDRDRAAPASRACRRRASRCRSATAGGRRASICRTSLAGADLPRRLHRRRAEAGDSRTTAPGCSSARRSGALPVALLVGSQSHRQSQRQSVPVGSLPRLISL